MFWFLFNGLVLLFNPIPIRPSSAAKLSSPPLSSRYSQEEYERQYLSSYRPLAFFEQVSSAIPDHLKQLLGNKTQLPQVVDWRNVTTAVKDQKKCGACWAFSGVETVESMANILHSKMKPLYELSVQEVIDCTRNSHGCSGGNTFLALDWFRSEQMPIVSESVYPLTDTTDTCKRDTVNGKLGICVTDVTVFHKVHEEDLLQLLVKGPVAVAVDATTWNNYLGGIIRWHCGSTLNHAVQIVGYDLRGPVPYYIVRNSWGADWGLEGYLHIRHGDNVCGIASEVTVVSGVKACTVS